MDKTPDIITSRKNASVLCAASLSDKKNRDALGLFAFEGIKLFEDAVNENIDIERVFVTRRAFETYGELLSLPNIADKLALVTDEVYEKMSFENAPQGVFTVARKFEEKKKTFAENAFVLLLDSLADPGNLGTVLRSADAFGADAVFVGAGSADIYNPKTVRASMGSLFRVKVYGTSDLADAVLSLRDEGFSVYAAMLDPSSESILSLSLSSGKVGFVVGNEGHGVCETVRAACTGSVIIPMAEGPQSLNAAFSASLLAWEVFRSRLGTK